MRLYNHNTISQPATASFMGLPVELRLEIYSLLPSRANIRRTKKRHFGRHDCLDVCCGLTIGDFSILGVNKQIRAEARPVIYQAVELAPGNPRRSLSATKHIRSIFVLCERVGDRWYCDRGAIKAPENPNRTLSVLWLFVAERFPNVRQVRLRIDRPHKNPNPSRDNERVQWKTFCGLSRLPNLRRVVVESYVYQHKGHQSERARSMFEMIGEEIEEEGKKIVVTQEFLKVWESEDGAERVDPKAVGDGSQGGVAVAESRVEA